MMRILAYLIVLYGVSFSAMAKTPADLLSAYASQAAKDDPVFTGSSAARGQ